MQTISLIRREYIHILMGLIFLGSPCINVSGYSGKKIIDLYNVYINALSHPLKKVLLKIIPKQIR